MDFNPLNMNVKTLLKGFVATLIVAILFIGLVPVLSGTTHAASALVLYVDDSVSLTYHGTTRESSGRPPKTTWGTTADPYGSVEAAIYAASASGYNDVIIEYCSPSGGYSGSTTEPYPSNINVWVEPWVDYSRGCGPKTGSMSVAYPSSKGNGVEYLNYSGFDFSATASAGLQVFGFASMNHEELVVSSNNFGIGGRLVLHGGVADAIKIYNNTFDGTSYNRGVLSLGNPYGSYPVSDVEVYLNTFNYTNLNIGTHVSSVRNNIFNESRTYVGDSHADVDEIVDNTFNVYTSTFGAPGSLYLANGNIDLIDGNDFYNEYAIVMGLPGSWSPTISEITNNNFEYADTVYDTVPGHFSAGVRVMSGSVGTIQSNSFVNHKRGVVVQTASGSVGSIDGNTFEATSNADGTQVNVIDGDVGSITNNAFSVLSGGSATDIRGITISGNVDSISGNTYSGFDFGIFLSWVGSLNSISGDVYGNVGDTAIYLRNDVVSVDDVNIYGSMISGVDWQPGTYGISIIGAYVGEISNSSVSAVETGIYIANSSQVDAIHDVNITQFDDGIVIIGFGTPCGDGEDYCDDPNDGTPPPLDYTGPSTVGSISNIDFISGLYGNASVGIYSDGAAIGDIFQNRFFNLPSVSGEAADQYGIEKLMMFISSVIDSVESNETGAYMYDWTSDYAAVTGEDSYVDIYKGNRFYQLSSNDPIYLQTIYIDGGYFDTVDGNEFLSTDTDIVIDAFYGGSTTGYFINNEFKGAPNGFHAATNNWDIMFAEIDSNNFYNSSSCIKLDATPSSGIATVTSISGNYMPTCDVALDLDEVDVANIDRNDFSSGVVTAIDAVDTDVDSLSGNTFYRVAAPILFEGGSALEVSGNKSDWADTAMSFNSTEVNYVYNNLLTNGDVGVEIVYLNSDASVVNNSFGTNYNDIVVDGLSSGGLSAYNNIFSAIDGKSLPVLVSADVFSLIDLDYNLYPMEGGMTDYVLVEYTGSSTPGDGSIYSYYSSYNDYSLEEQEALRAIDSHNKLAWYDYYPYADPSGGDYMLEMTSFGVDSADSSVSPATDMYGVARMGGGADMGAMEVTLTSDTDADGLWDEAESGWGADVANVDSDGDSISDGDEVLLYNTSPIDADSDGDSYNDAEEIDGGSNPLDSTSVPDDADLDHMDDTWEDSYACVDSSVYDADDDGDSDGLTNIEEYEAGTDPCDSYTDDDSLTDYEELVTYADTAAMGWSGADASALDPLNGDTDSDGLDDGEEVNTYASDPTDQDTDGDTLSDGDEAEVYGSSPTDTDSDDDTLPDGDEVSVYGTDPSDADTDSDGMDDAWEVSYSPDLDPNTDDASSDPDADGYSNLIEYTYGTDPTDSSDYPSFVDTDADGMDDVWEGDNGLSVGIDDSALDPDIDGLTNLEEYLESTDPNDSDTDGDNLSDGDEVDTYYTDPTDVDSDADGYNDDVEIEYGSDPNDSSETPDTLDSDSDGLSDWDEVETYGTDPSNSDSDGDSLTDYQEIAIYFTDPNDSDSDDDSLTDYEEVVTYAVISDFGWSGADASSLDPNNSDSDGDSYSDGVEVVTYATDPTDASDYPTDADLDGMDDAWEARYTCVDAYTYDADDYSDSDLLTNMEEYTAGTDPCDPDTDADSLDDYEEVVTYAGTYTGTYTLDPTNPDSDSDGLSDGEEVKTYSTDPTTQDSDGDSLIDGVEVTYATDPNDTDSDDDSLTDYEEVITYLTDPNDSDSDSDGLTDYEEIVTYDVISDFGWSGADASSLDPNNSDSDADGYSDGVEVTYATDPTDASDYPSDSDGDGVNDVDDLCPTEDATGYDDDADGCIDDTDGDGLYDDEEAYYGSDETDTDSDDDGLSDGDEVNTYGTDPTSTDSDSDGLLDGHEVNYYGTDPAIDDSSDYSYVDQMEYSSWSSISGVYHYYDDANTANVSSTDCMQGSYCALFNWSHSSVGEATWKPQSTWTLPGGPYDFSTLLGKTSGKPSTGHIGFWMKTDDYTAVSGLRIAVGDSNTHYIYGDVSSMPTDNDWHYYSVSLPSSTVYGSVDWTAIDFARFTVYEGSSSEIYIDGVWIDTF